MLFNSLSLQVSADDGYDLWLKYRRMSHEGLLQHYRRLIPEVIVHGTSETIRAGRDELQRGLGGVLDRDVVFRSGKSATKGLLIGTPKELTAAARLEQAGMLRSVGDEGYLIKSVVSGTDTAIVIAANHDIGLLYGTFHFLRLLQTWQPIDNLDIVSVPRIRYRLLDHWDNLDGTIERGYAGRSLWKWDQLPDTVDARYDDYARANASLGINGAVLNNVNANPAILKPEYLRKVAALAEVFRPYGIRVFLSANFASPISERFDLEGNRRGGIGPLPTADPGDPRVRQWWRDKVKEIYSLIPDFGGFLVKANSEGMPGPLDYGRTHADGANMLAEALEPYGGIVMWRAFVYHTDADPDRVKQAAIEFVPLDGAFRPNVFIQGKNGPLDFQPREPVQPLFGLLEKTPLMLELQITQEYLGHSTHLVYLAPMWKEYLDFDLYARGPGSTLASVIDGTLRSSSRTGIAGVANTGNDRNWCGNFFAQANWYAFGRLAWDHSLSAEALAEEWIRMSLGNDPRILEAVRPLMMNSWEACVDYMTPLGLHHIMQPDVHYGPGPSHGEGRKDWTSVYYHRAGDDGLGFNRSSTGSNAVGQYAPELRELFDTVETCPEKYLLWFHHVPWNHRMKSGRTLWEELCLRYHSGVEQVRQARDQWLTLGEVVDPELFSHGRQKLERQLADAGVWRDTCLTYFQTFSKQPIVVPD